MPSDLRKALRGVPSTSPPSAAIRWSAWRKVEVITAIRVGAITFSEACERYWLSTQMKYRSMTTNGAGPQMTSRGTLIENRTLGHEI
jgi:hypothetical protein